MVCWAIACGLTLLSSREMKVKTPNPMAGAHKYLPHSWGAQAKTTQVLNYIKTCHSAEIQAVDSIASAPVAVERGVR